MSDKFVIISDLHLGRDPRRVTADMLRPVWKGADHLIVNGDAADPKAECKRLGQITAKNPIDVAFVGIGENGHLAFNDPPADFDTEEAYIVANLDEACRRQQLGEGWFPTLADVPKQALSMTVKQLMKAKQILVIAPDARKANAIRACFDGEVSNLAPASILQRHPDTTVYLDTESAALLSPAAVEAYRG